MIVREALLCHDKTHLMAPLERDAKFQIRLTQDERQMLDVVADYDGFSASDAIRQLIRQRYTTVRIEIQRAFDKVKAKGSARGTSEAALVKVAKKTPKR